MVYVAAALYLIIFILGLLSWLATITIILSDILHYDNNDALYVHTIHRQCEVAISVQSTNLNDHEGQL